MKRKIRVRCSGTDMVTLNEMNVLQEELGRYQLKDLAWADFEKLRASIEAHGFWFPFFFWKDKAGAKYYLDGTQRDKVLNWMAERPDEYDMPGKFPAVEIFADNRSEAAAAILLQSSSYGKVTDDGIRAFIEAHAVDVPRMAAHIKLPDVDVGEVLKDYQLPGLPGFEDGGEGSGGPNDRTLGISNYDKPQRERL